MYTNLNAFVNIFGSERVVTLSVPAKRIPPGFKEQPLRLIQSVKNKTPLTILNWLKYNMNGVNMPSVQHARVCVCICVCVCRIF